MYFAGTLINGEVDWYVEAWMALLGSDEFSLCLILRKAHSYWEIALISI